MHSNINSASCMGYIPLKRSKHLRNKYMNSSMYCCVRQRQNLRLFFFRMIHNFQLHFFSKIFFLVVRCINANLHHLVMFTRCLCRFSQFLCLTLAIFCFLFFSDCSKYNENTAHHTTNNICRQQMNAAENAQLD